MTSKIFTINHVIGNTKLTSPLEKVIKSLHMLKLWDKEMERTQIMLKLWDKEMEEIFFFYDLEITYAFYNYISWVCFVVI